MASKTLSLFQFHSDNTMQQIPRFTQEEVSYFMTEGEKLSLHLTVYEVRACLKRTIASMSRAAEFFQSTQYAAKILAAKTLLESVLVVVYRPPFDFTATHHVAAANSDLFLNLVKCYESLGMMFIASKEHWETSGTHMGIMHNALEGVITVIKLVQQGINSNDRQEKRSANAVRCIKRTRNILANVCLFSQDADNTENSKKSIAAFRMSLMLSGIVDDSALFTRYNADVVYYSTFYMKEALEALERCRGFRGRCSIFNIFSDTVTMVAHFHNDAMKHCAYRKTYAPELRESADRMSSILLNILEASVLSEAFLSLSLDPTNTIPRSEKTQIEMQRILNNATYAFNALAEHQCVDSCKKTLNKFLFNGAYVKLEALYNQRTITDLDRKQLKTILTTIRRALDKINPHSPMYSRIWDSKISDLPLLPEEHPNDGRALITLPETAHIRGQQSRFKIAYNAVVEALHALVDLMLSAITKLWDQIKGYCRKSFTEPDDITQNIHHGVLEEEQELITGPTFKSVTQEKPGKRRPNYVSVAADVHELPENLRHHTHPHYIPKLHSTQDMCYSTTGPLLAQDHRTKDREILCKCVGTQTASKLEAATNTHKNPESSITSIKIKPLREPYHHHARIIDDANKGH